MEKQPSLPIKEQDIRDFYDDAGDYLKLVTYQPSRKAKRKSDESNEAEEAYFLLQRAIQRGSQQRGDTINIISLFKKLKDNSDAGLIALPAETNNTLVRLQEGVACGLYMKEAYAKSSGLETLEQIHSSSHERLDKRQQAEFQAKQQTATAVMLHTAAYYILHHLKSEMTDDDTVMRNKFSGIPEVNLSRPTKGISSVLYYYGTYLSLENFITSPQDTLSFTVLFFEAVLNEIQIRKDSLKYTELFTDRTYQLENSEFAINGWETDLGQASTVEFNKVKFEEIVGNKEAKHRAHRMIAMMLSFDFATHQNPFNEFGGFPTISMGYGKPGTGKSMLIAATATLLKERCDWLGYPFLFWPFPDNIVSTYQGGSAERALNWFKPLQDTNKIIYAPIDDAENSLQNRAERGVSAGVKEVIGVFLRQTEGAYAINHGNYMVGLYTNLPEQIDPAVLSRIQYRAPIDGATSPNDFMDQTHLWLQDYKELDEDFLSLRSAGNYEFLSDQKRVKALGDLNKDKSPRELLTQERILSIYEQVADTWDVNSYEFFGAFYKEVQENYSGFTSREVRNIHKIVGSRIMDFDLPDEVWKDPSVFFHKPYVEKVGILKELIRENMKSLNLGEIVLQEALKYTDNFARISDTEEQRKIEERVKEMRITEAARNQLRKE